MSTDYIHLHSAVGRVFLQEIRKGREAKGLEAINVMRWRDEAGQMGQDTHVRLALHLERGGELFIEHDGRVSSVVVEPGDRFLHTLGASGEDNDPILKLKTF